jgi:hypothetical protein
MRSGGFPKSLLYVFLCCTLAVAGCKEAKCDDVQDRAASVADPPRESTILSEIQDLDLVESVRYVRKLGAERNYAALAVIYDSDTQAASFAASEAVETMQTAEATAVCRHLDANFAKWGAALRSLARFHSKERVIAFLKETVLTNEEPRHRALCYSICMSSGWDDLKEYATRDLKSIVYYNIVNPLPGGLKTVGDIANEYIESCRDSTVDVN